VLFVPRNTFGIFASDHNQNMSILSFLKSEPKMALKPKWRFAPSGKENIVWKLLISPNGILTGEARDVEAKTGSLFAINVATGKVLWKEKRTDEAWWFGSELATERTLYLSNFRKPDMPEARGVIAIDIQTGNQRWEQPDVTLLFENGGRTYVARQRFSGREYFALDAHSGDILESYGEDESTIRAIASMVNEQDEHSVFTTPLVPEHDLYPMIGEMIHELMNVEDVRGAIDYAEFGKYLVFSYHDRMKSPDAMLKNLLKNELRVLDREDGSVAFADVLNAETPFPIPENFFINRGILIYVKNKQEVLGIELA
jgi:hypothetical protein